MEKLLTLCPHCATLMRDANYLLWPTGMEAKRVCDHCRKKKYAKNYMVRKRSREDQYSRDDR
jgi:hypothetical protein